jgi:hypothetical protein
MVDSSRSLFRCHRRFWYADRTMKDRDRQTKTGSHKAPSDVVGLYRRAFAEFRSRALWNIREFEEPTVEQVLAITRQLRTEGNMNARRLAEQIEEAARAHL